MVDVALSLGQLLLALVLVVLNGFFVASEFALVRIRETAVEGLVAEGRAGSATLQEAVSNLDDYLATTQLGITIASLGLGWVGEPAVADLIEPALGPLLPAGLLHLVSFAIGFGVITFLHVVFGELAPKTIAIARAERLALLIAPPMKLFYLVFLPGIVVFNGTANAFTSAIGVPPASETEETLTEEEILLVLSRAGRAGDVDAEEVEMIERVFELDDISAREVMVPRPDVVSVPGDAPLADLRDLVEETGHTRYPVTDPETNDEVIGFVDAKDVLVAMDDGTSTTVGEVAREVPILPETARLDELLAAFQREGVQIAVVIDEWGSFEGIATVEDVVEVVVGDLRDAFDPDREDREIRQRTDGTYAVSGGAGLAALNEELGTSYEAEDFGTVGGFVLDRLARAPEVGDRVEADDYAFVVERVDGARIERLLVQSLDEASESDSEDA